MFIRYLKRIARFRRHARSNPNLVWTPSAAFVTTPCSKDDKYRSEVEFEDRLLKPVLDTAEAQWIVGTDIDLDTTYVGGSAELIDELLGAQGLEAVEAYPDDYATPNDSLDYAGDPDLWQLKRAIRPPRSA